MGQNLAKRINQMQDTFFSEGIRVGIQYNNDLMFLVLNDPDYMGKDVFGAKRLQKLHEAAEEAGNYFADMLDARKPEADVLRAKMDKRLKQILGDKFAPFEVRYDTLTEVRYGKRK